MSTYSEPEIKEKLADFPGWTLDSEGFIQRSLTFKSFKEVMFFVNALAYIAEAKDHHPDMLIHGWKHLLIRLMSHDVGGITDRDFRFMTAIESLNPPKPE